MASETLASDFRAGPFILSYLCGPDNEYRAFAHVTAAGDDRLWHCFREDSTLAAALAALAADPTEAGSDAGAGAVVDAAGGAIDTWT